jgi:hypothetical protein
MYIQFPLLHFLAVDRHHQRLTSKTRLVKKNIKPLFMYGVQGITLPHCGGRQPKRVARNAMCMHLTCFAWASSWIFNNKKHNMLIGTSNTKIPVHSASRVLAILTKLFGSTIALTLSKMCDMECYSPFCHHTVFCTSLVV